MPNRHMQHPWLEIPRHQRRLEEVATQRSVVGPEPFDRVHLREEMEVAEVPAVVGRQARHPLGRTAVRCSTMVP